MYVVLAAASLALLAAVQPMTITIPINDIQRGDPGERFLVAEAALPDGVNCTGVLKTDNNQSVHPDTNVIMESATTAIIADVEVASYESRSLALRSGTFESNGQVKLYVQVGPDKVSSTGWTVTIECSAPTTTTTTTVPPLPETTTTTHPPHPTTTTTTAPPATTTTTEPPTTTTAPPPEGETTTTTEPAPINGIDTGGGACAEGACDPTNRNGLLLAGLLSMLGVSVLIGSAKWKASR